MKHKKNMYVPINPWDRRRMVKFLEAQAEKGWMFCGFAGKLWQFRLIEPKKVHFSVVYFPADFEKDDSAVPRLLEFREFCAHDGWELAGADMELQVFYSLKENPNPIDTDPNIEIATMQTVAMRKFRPEMKRSMIMLGIYLLIGVLAYSGNVVDTFLNPILFLGLLTFGGVVLVNLLGMGEQYIWYLRAKKTAAREGEYPHDLKVTRFSSLVRFVLGIALAWMIVQAVGIYLLLSAFAVLCILVMIGFFLTKWIDNRLLSSRIKCILNAAVLVGIIALYIGSMRVIVDTYPDDIYAYAPYGSHWAQYEDAPPISLEEYYGEDLENPRYYSWVEETPFLAKFVGHMDAARGEDWVELDYEIMEVKWDALYDVCLKEYRREIGYEVDAVPWGADQVYRLGSTNIPRPVWILCYKDRIIRFYASEEPTHEQMAMIGETLG